MRNPDDIKKHTLTNSKHLISSHAVIITMHVNNLLTYRLASNGYVMNFASKGISGKALLYFTRHTSSDLKTQNIWSKGYQQL